MNPDSSPVFSSDPTPTQPAKAPIGRTILRQVPLLLALLVIGGMLFAWKPWQPVNSTDRTVSVTGEAEVSAEPDEYTFNPQYEFKNANKDAALADSTAKVNSIVAKLKELGVASSKIKTDTSGYDDYNYNSSVATTKTYYTYLTVVVDKKDTAQKVQDYLLTTTPSGSVTPSATFSKAAETKLKDAARDEASKDARKKAEQNAKNLGFEVGKVKSFTDNPDNNRGIAYTVTNGATLAAGADSATASKTSAAIQQGENKLTYTVQVTYYIH